MINQGIALEAYGRTDIGRVRDSNQDAFVIADLGGSQPIHAMLRPLEMEVGERGVLLAVADGIGGAHAGAVASALTLEWLRRSRGGGKPSAAEANLTPSVERANRRVWETIDGPERDGRAAALAAVLIDGTDAFVAEVGESRAYVQRGSHLTPLAHDESCMNVMQDAGNVIRERVGSFQYKNVIQQALGADPDAVLALNRFALQRGDRILLCSDGLTRELDERDIRAILATTPILDVACARLIELSNSRGGQDNVTVLVADVSGERLQDFTA